MSNAKVMKKGQSRIDSMVGRGNGTAPEGARFLEVQRKSREYSAAV